MSRSYTANGNVPMSSIVKPDSSAPFRVIVAAAATDPLIGVASEAADRTPIPQDTGTQYAAIAGEDLKVYTVGDECSVQTASTGLATGDAVTSDGSGNGVTTTTTHNVYVGRALDTLATTGLVRILVEPGYIG